MGNKPSKVKESQQDQPPVSEKTRSAPPFILTQTSKAHTAGLGAPVAPSRTGEDAPTRTEHDPQTHRRGLRAAEAQSAKLDDDHQRHVAKLRAEWEKEIQESQIQRGLVEARTKERDEAHALLAQLGEDVKGMETHFKKLEERRKVADEEAAEQKRGLEAVAAQRQNETEETRAGLRQAEEQLRLQQQTTDQLEGQLEDARKDARIRDAEMEGVKRNLAEATQKSQALEEHNTSMTNELEQIRVRTAAESTGAEAELKEATEKVAALEVEKRALVEELAELKTETAERMAKARSDPVAPTPSVLTPTVDTTALEEELAATKAALAAVTVSSEAQSPQSPSLESKPPQQVRRMPSFQNEFSEPVSFSSTHGEDFRLGVRKGDGGQRVEICEWYAGVRSRKGVAISARDAQELLNLLPHAIRKAEMV